MRFIIPILILFTFKVISGPSIWTLNQSSTSEVFNGISAANNYFAIAVGKNGSIVHFNNGDNGTLMPSGTNKELYDVYVASENLAIATGEDIVLWWNGSIWATVFADNTSSIYTGTWITPERDFLYYQSLGFFNIICPYEIGAVQQGFCRANTQPMLAMCGERDDIKLILADGSIMHHTNILGDYSGSDPLHDELNPLSLTGVYIPEDACIPGPVKPLNIYAINNTNEFYHFDGDQWNNMGVSIPNDQTLTWLNGSSSNNVIATGFKPNMSLGNDGVIWNYNGTTWLEDGNLPAGTPGLTDVAVNIGLIDALFSNGFEMSTRGFSNADVKVDILAAAEEGKYIHTADLFPNQVSDLSISKRLLTAGPISTGDRITFQIVIQNRGPGTATDFRFLDGYFTSIQIAEDNCGMTEFNFQSGWRYRDVRIPELQAGGVHTCTMEFDVVGSVGDIIRNYAAVGEADEHNYKNNRGEVRGITIQ